jgi:DNA-binding transcriptional MerR regulator
MRIQRVAQLMGLTSDTLRFYEQEGLLGARHVVREPNGYRSYTQEALTRLRLVRLGQAMGFSLAEIGRYIQRWEAGEIVDAEKLAIYDAQIAKVEMQLRELDVMRTYLQEKRALIAQWTGFQISSPMG